MTLGQIKKVDIQTYHMVEGHLDNVLLPGRVRKLVPDMCLFGIARVMEKYLEFIIRKQDYFLCQNLKPAIREIKSLDKIFLEKEKNNEL